MKKRILRPATLEAIRRMTPMDDILFANIYHDNIPAMNELLRVCLGDESISVTEVRTHAAIPNMQDHSVIFDAKARDGNGRLFDVEVQRVRGEDLLKRASFYAAMLQREALRPGERASKLRSVYVIFITEWDYWHSGLDRVDVCTYLEQLGRRVDDGRHIVFINGEAKGDSAIARMMQDYRYADPEHMYYNELRKSVERLKNTEEGMGNMGGSYEEIIEQGIEKGKIEGREENQLETAMKMKADSFPVEKISKYTGLSVEVIEAL